MCNSALETEGPLQTLKLEWSGILALDPSTSLGPEEKEQGTVTTGRVGLVSAVKEQGRVSLIQAGWFPPAGFLWVALTQIWRLKPKDAEWCMPETPACRMLQQGEQDC